MDDQICKKIQKFFFLTKKSLSFTQEMPSLKQLGTI